MQWKTRIPVVDLFAGPGGLGEGFSCLKDDYGNHEFDVRVSIEKDHAASETLRLRSVFRTFSEGKVPDCYYDYLRGHITKNSLVEHISIREAWEQAKCEAHQATLGETPSELIDSWIEKAIRNHDTWVLIGGPPCQAYSIVGRARMRNTDPNGFENDERHFLYKEYLRIIQKFKPAIFVMENVKGILSSTHGGSLIFSRILEDLSQPDQDLRYDIRSFVTAKPNPKPKDFVIEAERYGTPQRRHRVILLGIRSDHAKKNHKTLIERNQQITVQQILSSMPQIRGRLSLKSSIGDSFEGWLDVLRNTPNLLSNWKHPKRADIEELMMDAFQQARFIKNIGGRFIENSKWADIKMPMEIGKFIGDPQLGGVCQHESRSHMPSDLNRYFFAACHAEVCGFSPWLDQYPTDLWPEHKNVNATEVPFPDRFRVQSWNMPSTTVVAHIAKDGHYFIHPDPCQCRSMTVREAARLQTFPDNYFFEGNKTSQYTQVGNAVPPYLAKQLAEIVAEFLNSAVEKNMPPLDSFRTSAISTGELLEL